MDGGDAELQARAAQYDAMAHMHATVTFDDRRAFDTASVRHLNNFVKACMVDVACKYLKRRCGAGIRVADIACGRGQDQSKWVYGARAAGAAVAAYFGLELSDKLADAAKLMAGRYLADAEVSIQSGNMGDVRWACDAPVSVVTCQLALHYLCDAEAHVHHFFREARRLVDPAGLLLVSFADGRAVVRRARDVAPEHASHTYRRRYYVLDVPTSSAAALLPSPFGNQYVFTMPGSVEQVPEYLCHEGILTKIAAQYGFYAGTSMYFDELAVFFNSVPYFQGIAEKMGGNGMGDADALDVANLYRFVVFAPTQEGVAEFGVCMRRYKPARRV